MLRSEIKVCVLRIEGTNCEQEAHDCIKRLGAVPEIVHLKQLIGSGIRQEWKRDLSEYNMLVIPGGFSAGDYVRAGAIFAARLRSSLEKPLKYFVEHGSPVLGICNGFQVLVEVGLLPAIDSIMTPIPSSASRSLRQNSPRGSRR